MSNGFSDQLSGKRIFITGGAGFIGSRLSRALAEHGAAMTVYDNLLEQVHGPEPKIRLPGTFILGDVRDRQALADAVIDCQPEIVVHLAAETGTGQSADEPGRYCSVNVVGMANVIEVLRELAAPPSRFVLASTRAIYGEGAYRGRDGGLLVPAPRNPADMAAGEFDVLDEFGARLEPLATSTSLPPSPGSVYGSSKLMQEYLLRQTPAPWEHVILRLQNVYGPGQSLRNPYTGVLSIFARQAMSGQSINIYEDGEIYRDFIFVDDVVAAFVAACSEDRILNQTVNVGTGVATSILRAAHLILGELGIDQARCRVSGDFRAGDVRHAVADVSQTFATTSWRPAISPEEGIRRLTAWAKEELDRTSS
jgi:dTDP-L-rhamnose 4-epimerase